MNTRKKILLLYPNQRWQKEDMVTTWNLNPAVLCLLGGMVKDLVDVVVVDAQFRNLSRDDFTALLLREAPEYVGISVLTTEYKDTLDLAARLTRQALPAAIIIAGGVHVTTCFDYVMRNPDIDYAVRGEGEYVLRDLLQHLLTGAPLPEQGLIRRAADGTLLVQPRALVADLAKLPWPDYSLVDMQAYLHTPSRERSPNRPPAMPFVRMSTTRGCPYGCSFCQVETIAGRKVRARAPEDVVAELQWLKREWGIKAVIFDDDDLLAAPHDFAARLFRGMIEAKLELKWVSTAFALFLVTDELLELMKRSGCVGINVAIESGTPRVLHEIIGKPIKDLDRVRPLIEKIKANGMYVLANFIIGFPGETWEEIRQTLAFAEHCAADYVKIYTAIPLPGTRLFEVAKRLNVLVCDSSVPEVDWRYGRIQSPEWSAKDVSILRAYEWDRINFRPQNLARMMELWGCSETELREVRKKTRDSLVF